VAEGCHEFLHDFDLLVVGQQRKHRQTDRLGVIALSLRKILAVIAALGIIRLPVDGNVVQVGDHAISSKSLEDFTLVGLHRLEVWAHDVKVKRRISFWVLPRGLHRFVSEQQVILMCELLTAQNIFVESLHLASAERRINIGHAIVETKFELLVVPKPIRWFCQLSSITRHTVAA